jgi:beta-N-acetylhexosaminidase
MTRRSCAAMLASILLAACGSTAAAIPTPSPPASPSPSPSPPSCGQQLFARLTITQRIGQLIFVGLANDQLGAAERAVIRDDGAGGVWYTELTSAPISQIAATSAQAQALAPAGIGLLVAANQEGGTIDALHGPGFSPIPSALQQGSEDPATLQAQAEIWAAQLKQAGVNLDLAPVMDTVPPGEDHSNAPIGSLQREFGHDPGTVSAHGLAFIAGMHAANVMVTIKHFPGLGRVQGNTDFASSVVDSTTTANDPYLAPFQNAIDAGTDLVMISTATYTQIDPNHLAVFSPTILGLLRGPMHFEGVVVSDDLGSAVAVASIPAGTRAADFIAAGGDLVTVKTADLVAPMVGAIAQRAASDPDFAAKVDAAVLRVLDLKVHAGIASC